MTDMIGTKEIATMLGVSREHCVNRIIKRPDFPRPAIDLSQRMRRWKRQDVMRWMGLVK